jgi:hypothetical protein
MQNLISLVHEAARDAARRGITLGRTAIKVGRTTIQVVVKVFFTR